MDLRMRSSWFLSVRKGSLTGECFLSCDPFDSDFKITWATQKSSLPAISLRTTMG